MGAWSKIKEFWNENKQFLNFLPKKVSANSIP